MRMNFKGLVNLHTLPVTLPLLPLYEAVINSIQSIEDAKINDGKIEVIIEREKQIKLFNNWETDIENIIIKDNGIGFTNDNYTSFNTYASEYKLQKGCKGVGRMLWLKAFCDVEITSIYDENGKRMRRKFVFDTKKEVHNLSITEVENCKERETEVKLNTLREQYKVNCPKKLDTIAKNILNHCFAYYVLEEAPKILVKDNQNIIDLDKIYNENIRKNINVVTVNFNDIDLKIIHSKNYMLLGNKHEVNLCAHKRVVQPTNLSKLFTNLNTKLQDEKGEFIYNGYVLSDILDTHVNRERTKFNLPEQKNLVEKIGWNEIFNIVKQNIAEFLKNDIKKSNQKKRRIYKKLRIQ